MLRIAAFLAASALSTAAFAQETVKFADVIELSGDGATVGVLWKNAVDLAVREINEKGGLLGKKIAVTHYDTQTNPGVSRAQVQKALDEKPYVILGPIYSGSIKVNMALAQQAQIPQIMGGEAGDLTQLGNPYIFRTSFGQQMSMPKIAAYLADEAKVKTVAVLYVNNDFGKGGRNAFKAEMDKRGVKVLADVSAEAGQVDFASDVSKIKSSNADAVFVYMNEEECARFLTEARKQDLKQPIYGETTILNQKVIELAGPAANGVKGHVGLSADAPVQAITDFTNRYKAAYKDAPDHNAIKAYLGVYAVKAVTERIGKFDSQALAAALHGATITPAQEPGILMEATWDKNGDIDRESFLAEIIDGKQKITRTLPKLNK